MAERSNVLVFPEGGNSNSIDPSVLLAMNNGNMHNLIYVSILE